MVTTCPEIELTLPEIAGLIDELDSYHSIFSPLFRRSEQSHHAYDYLHGLLLDIPRKSIEPMVIELQGRADGNAIRAKQQFVGQGGWADAAILSRHWQEVDVSLGEADGVIIMDGSDFPKQGNDSVGVKRQYCGQLGKRANCQAGVFLAYASQKGRTLLAGGLYMPEEWLFDEAYAERRTKCAVPDDLTFQTKQEIAYSMLKAVDEQQSLRYAWVLGDEAFGRDSKLLDDITHLGKYYFMEIPNDTRVWRHLPDTEIPAYGGKGRKPTRQRLIEGADPAEEVGDIAQSVTQWRQYTIKEGSKGPMVAEFAFLRVINVREGLPGTEVWLVLRRNIQTHEIKYYLSNAPKRTSQKTLVHKSGMRWPIETCLEEGKQKLGMGDYEVRSWKGWHHHITLAILAHHFLVRLEQRLKKSAANYSSPNSIDTQSGTA